MNDFDIRKAADRFETKIDWLHARPSFSFGEHHDPKNTHHGLLVVHNEDRISPSGGFDTHPHADMEIVTWVLSGALKHRDSMGNEGTIRPGLAQRMSAGTGILHSEHNASDSEECHLVQMWVFPDEKGITPEYEQAEVGERLDSGRLFALASGSRPDAAIRIHQKGATLWAGRFPAGAKTSVPDGGHVHAFLAKGSASLPDGRPLETGDALRLKKAGEVPLLVGSEGAELLIWETL